MLLNIMNALFTIVSREMNHKLFDHCNKYAAIGMDHKKTV